MDDVGLLTPPTTGPLGGNVQGPDPVEPALEPDSGAVGGLCDPLTLASEHKGAWLVVRFRVPGPPNFTRYYFNKYSLGCKRTVVFP